MWPSPNTPMRCRSIGSKASMPATASSSAAPCLRAGWGGRVGFHPEPLADRVLHHIRAGERIFADETTLPTLAPGTGKTKTAWLWTYVRDDRPFGRDGPPMVAYRFEDSRGGACVERHL